MLPYVAFQNAGIVTTHGRSGVFFNRLKAGKVSTHGNIVFIWFYSPVEYGISGVLILRTSANGIHVYFKTSTEAWCDIFADKKDGLLGWRGSCQARNSEFPLPVTHLFRIFTDLQFQTQIFDSFENPRSFSERRICWEKYFYCQHASLYPHTESNSTEKTK